MNRFSKNHLILKVEGMSLTPHEYRSMGKVPGMWKEWPLKGLVDLKLLYALIAILKQTIWSTIAKNPANFMPSKVAKLLTSYSASGVILGHK